MRQAGRYMAEYRELRKKHTLIEICKAPELALEVTLQPRGQAMTDAEIDTVSKAVVASVAKATGATLRG